MRGVVQILVNMRRRGGKLITILQNHLHTNRKFRPDRAPGIIMDVDILYVTTYRILSYCNWGCSHTSLQAWCPRPQPGGRRGCEIKSFLLQVAFTIFLHFVCTSRNWSMLSPEEATKPNTKSPQSLLLNIYCDGFLKLY
jgi:hypothetical protein